MSKIQDDLSQLSKNQDDLSNLKHDGRKCMCISTVDTFNSCRRRDTENRGREVLNDATVTCAHRRAHESSTERDR